MVCSVETRKDNTVLNSMILLVATRLKSTSWALPPVKTNRVMAVNKGNPYLIRRLMGVRMWHGGRDVWKSWKPENGGGDKGWALRRPGALCAWPEIRLN